MVSNSIIYTFLVLMGIILIGSMHASSSDQTSNSQENEYEDMMSNEHQLASRGARLPPEAILLGKRRLPAESILLGRRRLPAESILLGKRRLPAESILLGKRRLPAESILLGKRR